MSSTPKYTTKDIFVKYILPELDSEDFDETYTLMHHQPTQMSIWGVPTRGLYISARSPGEAFYKLCVYIGDHFENDPLFEKCSIDVDDIDEMGGSTKDTCIEWHDEMVDEWVNYPGNSECNYTVWLEKVELIVV